MVFDKRKKTMFYFVAKIDNQLSIRDLRLKIRNNGFNHESNICYSRLILNSE